MNIPNGFEIETLAVNNAKSMTSAYNKAMKASDAKYKVYLHEDKLKIMMNNFIQKPEISIITCYKKEIDENGVETINQKEKLFNNVTCLDANYMKELFLNTRKNFIGDITTPILKKVNFKMVSLEFFIKNNIITELLYEFKKLLFYIKDSRELKDIFIKNYYNEIVEKICTSYEINKELFDGIISDSDKKIVHGFINERAFSEYIINFYNFKGDEYKEFKENKVKFSKEDVKYIAFYLPQFHTIAEKDKWWGKGFTEWTNVTRAVPMFVNHYQPQLPGELGFYNLNDVSIMKRQIKLSQNYGVYGFCYYYYWFNGKRLLEKPVDNFFQDKSIDFPFCLCWANENWTRKWSGSEEDVLISQNHSSESDIYFIKDLLKYSKDRRYIKINNRPLLIVYRADIIPNIKQTVERWREYCRINNIGEIYIVGAETFNFSNPNEYGFDASVQFPPHQLLNYNSRIDEFKTINKNFNGTVFDYKKLVEDKEYMEDKEYKSFKTVFPAWDNTSRRPNSSLIFYGSKPKLYEKWLDNITIYTKDKFVDDERIVFINAWNEWAEGAHLEPDRRFGYAYLESTYNVFKMQKDK